MEVWERRCVGLLGMAGPGGGDSEEVEEMEEQRPGHDACCDAQRPSDGGRGRPSTDATADRGRIREAQFCLAMGRVHGYENTILVREKKN